MDPNETGSKYNKIAHWWHQRHKTSIYGVEQLTYTLNFVKPKGNVLDVGCGAGGRFIELLAKNNYDVTGIDVSKEMISLAKENHPKYLFLHQDICTWQTDSQFDLIYAWDSIFHLPYTQQKLVVEKLCDRLSQGGVLMYTFGNDVGEHTDQWLNDTFYYSSIGINENLKVLIAKGLKILHLCLDQYPEKHVVVVAQKP